MPLTPNPTTATFTPVGVAMALTGFGSPERLAHKRRDHRGFFVHARCASPMSRRAGASSDAPGTSVRSANPAMVAHPRLAAWWASSSTLETVMSDISMSLLVAQDRFLAQLQRWQADNNGQAVTRTSAEWQAATGLDDATLTRVRQALRARGVLTIQLETAWSFSAQERAA